MRASSSFSALQRAEIAEMLRKHRAYDIAESFSALQRAEIAELNYSLQSSAASSSVSVLFNEPKLLKLRLELQRGVVHQ